MSDLISRQWCLDEYDRQHQGPAGNARRIIENAPSAEKTGKWIYDDEAYPGGNPYGHYDCDQCGESVPCKTNYCPNCGARMKNEEYI